MLISKAKLVLVDILAKAAHAQSSPSCRARAARALAPLMKRAGNFRMSNSSMTASRTSPVRTPDALFPAAASSHRADGADVDICTDEGRSGAARASGGRACCCPTSTGFTSRQHRRAAPPALLRPRARAPPHPHAQRAVHARTSKAPHEPARPHAPARPSPPCAAPRPRRTHATPTRTRPRRRRRTPALPTQPV